MVVSINGRKPKKRSVWKKGRMSHRIKQLESALQRTIGGILLGGLNDPRVSGMISVTSVEISRDGDRAKVGISVLPEDKAQLTLKGLRAAAKHIRHEVSEKLRARTIPKICFELDDSLKKEAAILGEIRMAIDEIPESAEGDAGAEGDGELNVGGGDVGEASEVDHFETTEGSDT